MIQQGCIFSRTFFSFFFTEFVKVYELWVRCPMFHFSLNRQKPSSPPPQLPPGYLLKIYIPVIISKLIKCLYRNTKKKLEFEFCIKGNTAYFVHSPHALMLQGKLTFLCKRGGATKRITLRKI